MINNIEQVEIAKQIFNILLLDGTIARLVDNMPKQLDYTNAETPVIHQLVAVHGNRFSPEVHLYRPWNPWSRAIATTYTGNWNYIGLNSRKINRSIPSIVGSIAHEWGHCFEYFVKSFTNKIYFNHGNNSPIGKDNTFQYLLGRKVKAYVEEYSDELLRRLAVIS